MRADPADPGIIAFTRLTDALDRMGNAEAGALAGYVEMAAIYADARALVVERARELTDEIVKELAATPHPFQGDEADCLWCREGRQYYEHTDRQKEPA